MMIHLLTARLARWQIRTLIISGSVLWLTGLAWLILHLFGRLQGEFGPETNPAEPWMLRIHGAAVIVALLGLGTLLVVHVWKGWAYARQRLLGLILTGVILLLIVTGYLLYYVGDESLRNWVSVIHWAVGLALPVAFVLHYKRGIKLRRHTVIANEVKQSSLPGSPRRWRASR